MKFQHPNLKQVEPVKIIKWEYDYSFHQWGAVVMFDDVGVIFTWPELRYANPNKQPSG